MPISPAFLTVCKKCKAFCCTAVLPPITEQEKNDILDAGFTDHFMEKGNRIYTLKPGKKGACPYLSNEYSCLIQKVKPKLCKIWPIIPRIKNHSRTCIIIHCPLHLYLSPQEIQQAKHESEMIPDIIIDCLWDAPSTVKEKYKRFTYEEI